LLIEGETGTGKEVVAESVHRNSARAEGPFIVFDCSAVVSTLVESALFGHERGAFTGAVSAHAGVFEQAHGGTIFLDELGELPLELQPRLLRVLQKREVIRLGAQRSMPVDVRVIAATNRNLMQEVQQRRFREDLYYRVAATHVLVPPLRERVEDIPQLVEYFLSQADPPQSSSRVPSDVWAMFRAHRWPGNVRELQNVLQRFVVMPERLFSGTPSEPTAVTPPPGRQLKPLQVARREASEAFERNYLDELMRQANGNVSTAARLAEVSRQMLHKMLRKQRIDATGPDDGAELIP
jgi:transcriptional regulator with GAF, ATPase, and Fis domain